MRAEFIVFFIFLAIFLYVKLGGKIAIPGISNAGSTLRSLLLREQIATTALFALFLLTFSYAFGNSWKGVFGWWWNSQMAIPLVFAVLGIVIFAKCEWRKRVNKTLMFLIVALIATTFAVNAFMGWWTGGEKAVTPAIAEAVTKPAPQPAIVVTPEPPKPRIEKVEREVVGEYGVFTKAELPPMEKLVELKLDGKTQRDWNDCLVAIVYDDAPEGRVWRCREIPPKGIVQKNITRVGISSSRVERNTQVTVKFTYVPPI